MVKIKAAEVEILWLLDSSVGVMLDSILPMMQLIASFFL